MRTRGSLTCWLVMTFLGIVGAGVSGAAQTLAGRDAGAAPLVVTTTDDVGDGTCDATHCSLRDAIAAASANPGSDSIGFAIPGTDANCDSQGVCRIQPTELLPFLTDDSTTIDGYTQPGAVPGAVSAGVSPVLKIVLDGHNNGGFSGLAIRAAHCVVRGLVIQRFTPFTGIDVAGVAAHDTHIEGNFIGTDVTGTQGRGNCTPPVSCGAVWIKDGAHDNTIGPDNLIAFNGVGVWITDAASVGNRVTRNLFHDNSTKGIRIFDGNLGVAPPLFTTVTPHDVTGTACGGCTVEIYSDADGQGAHYEGTAVANPTGAWTFTQPAGFAGPNLTATATDGAGNTSELSDPVPATASTPTPTATTVATETVTPTPPASPTVTSVATVTPSQPPCAGDCDDNRAVTIDDLITMVLVALGSAPATVCPAGDTNGDGSITVDDLIVAVNVALTGCPPTGQGRAHSGETLFAAPVALGTSSALRGVFAGIGRAPCPTAGNLRIRCRTVTGDDPAGRPGRARAARCAFPSVAAPTERTSGAAPAAVKGIAAASLPLVMKIGGGQAGFHTPDGRAG